MFFKVLLCSLPEERGIDRSVQCQLAVSFVILSNAAVIGLETDHYAVSVCATLENVSRARGVASLQEGLFESLILSSSF